MAGMALTARGPAKYSDRILVRFLAPVILGLTVLFPAPALADRRSKTVFRSQPVEWNLEEGEDQALPTLAFTPAWTWSGFAAPLAGDPVAVLGSIVAAARDGGIAALRDDSGEVAWRASVEAPLTVGPATDGTLVFLATAEGHLVSLKGTDGLPGWSADLASGPAVPIRVIGRRLLVGTLDGTLYSIDAATGRIEARQALPGRPSTTPEPAPGSILIGTDHGVVLALDEASLAPLWRYSAGPAITSPPAYDEGRVFFTAADRSIRSLRFRSGRRRWTTRSGATCSVRPIPRDAYLYVLCFDNDIYVLNKRNGHQLTRIRMGHRLDSEPAETADQLLVVPFTEASVVGLSLPRLRTVGRFALDVPGEWFTTAPLLVGRRVALGYGRDQGRILSLSMAEKKKEEEEETQAPVDSKAPGP
jgi:outer membrane protein assembly factor BamB